MEVNVLTLFTKVRLITNVLVIRMEIRMTNQFCILIPAYCPSTDMVNYVEELIRKGEKDILVVNDGSSKDYDAIFSELSKFPNCEIIGYETNKGKGAALKYGLQHIIETRRELIGVVTADCDGQHTVKDVQQIIQAIKEHQKELILGVRNFNISSNGEKIPARSKLGNKFSSIIFYLLYHRYLQDTQTGLRGFSTEFFPLMCNIKGNRYEYETQVLIDCTKENIPFYEVPISTIYENNNSGSHFHPIKDSFRIINTMLLGFFMFIASSLISALVDTLCAWILLDLLKPVLNNSDLLRITIATICARLISMSVNYTMNKNMVFKSNTSSRKTFIRYIILCIIVMLLSSIFVYLANRYLYWNEKFAKIIVDCLLFFFSYQIQKGWVFHS